MNHYILILWELESCLKIHSNIFCHWRLQSCCCCVGI